MIWICVIIVIATVIFMGAFGGFAPVVGRCHRCGDSDDEMNTCQSCGKETCTACIGDMITGNCLDCED